jgi:hypothetical protein
MTHSCRLGWLSARDQRSTEVWILVVGRVCDVRIRNGIHYRNYCESSDEKVDVFDFQCLIPRAFFPLLMFLIIAQCAPDWDSLRVFTLAFRSTESIL